MQQLKVRFKQKMRTKALFFLFSSALVVSGVGFAANTLKAKRKTTPKVNSTSPWSGDLSLGLVSNTGNTKTTNINGSFNVDFNKDKWINSLDAEGQYEKDDKKVKAENYELDGELNYFFKPKYYVFGRASYRQDRFNAFDYTTSETTGLGARLIETKHFIMDAQAGPGLMQSREAETQKTINQVVGYAAINMQWRITNKTSITQLLSIEAGSPNTYTKSVTALNTALVGNFGLSVSFTAERNSYIPKGSEDTEKLDTRTNVALVYSFGGGDQTNEYTIF